jgi:hypothetical protein
MKILTKRNAVLGWLTWKVGKGVAKKKAKGVVPGKSQGASGKRKAGVFAGIAAAVGGLAILKKKRKGGGAEPSE